MVRPSWVLPLCLTLPLPLLAAGASSAADALGRRGGRALGAATETFLRSPPSAPLPVFVEPLAPSEPPESAPEGPAKEAAAPVRSTRRAPATSPVPAKGVRVRAEVVLRLANSGARPGGFPVPASGARPRGLALTGVSGLGIGLEDGDVLTHAAGRPALTPGDVIGVVVGSRRARAPEIWGRFWRNGEPWNLVVEQPYPKQRRAPERLDSSAPGKTAQVGSS